MIRRVLTPPGNTDLTVAGLPPGTPVTGGMQVVHINQDLAQIGSIPADALVTSDGAPVYATGPMRWGQVVQAGRP